MELTKSEKRIMHNILIFLVQAATTYLYLIADKLMTYACEEGEELYIYAGIQSDVCNMVVIAFTFFTGYAVFCDVYIRGIDLLALFSISAFWHWWNWIYIDGILCLVLYHVSTIVLVCRMKENKECNVSDVCRRLLSVSGWLLYPLLAVVIGFNIWHIMSPKNALYAYIKPEGEVICQIDGEPSVEFPRMTVPQWKMPEEEEAVVYAELPFDICTESSKNPFELELTPAVYEGCRILAQNEGTATVTFREVFSSDNRKWGRLTKEIQVRVDERLKMHFDIDFAYVTRIYRENLYVIVVCILWMLASLLYHISMCVRRKK